MNERISGFFVQLQIVNSATYTKLALYGLQSLYLGIYVCTHMHVVSFNEKIGCRSEGQRNGLRVVLEGGKKGGCCT